MPGRLGMEAGFQGSSKEPAGICGGPPLDQPLLLSSRGPPPRPPNSRRGRNARGGGGVETRARTLHQAKGGQGLRRVRGGAGLGVGRGRGRGTQGGAARGQTDTRTDRLTALWAPHHHGRVASPQAPAAFHHSFIVVGTVATAAATTVAAMATQRGGREPRAGPCRPRPERLPEAAARAHEGGGGGREPGRGAASHWPRPWP